MALRRVGEKSKRNWNTVASEEFHYINLIRHMQQLKELGFFYTREWVCYDEDNGECNIWNYNKTWLKRVISEEWLQKTPEEISMEFEHFLTGEKIYLHIVWEAYGYKKGGRTRVFTSGRKCIRNEKYIIENKKEACFQMLLRECDIYTESMEFRPISEYAIRSKQDGFFSALCKNRYRQTKASNMIVVGEVCAYEYWAGEFLQNDETEKDDAEYVYLVQVRKCKPVRYDYSYGYSEVFTRYYMLKSKERKAEVCVNGEMELKLKDMQWQKGLFDSYFDLPEEEYDVEKVWIEKTEYVEGDNIEEFLRILKKSGYMYRRERVMRACSNERAKGEIIKEKTGFYSQYIQCGLSEILMEFMNPETGERAYIEIKPKCEMCYISNGVGDENYDRFHTENFRNDRTYREIGYDEFCKENSDAEFSEGCDEEWEEDKLWYEFELILSEPICLELLKKYELIEEDLIKISRLSGQEELQDWFKFASFVLRSSCESDIDDELMQEEAERAARARRIIKHLKYQLKAIREVEGRKVEVYMNKKRERAICLIENDCFWDVKFVDKYMNLNKALPYEGMSIGLWGTPKYRVYI